MSDLGNIRTMSANINRLMKRNGIDRRKLSNDLNVSYTTLADWINAKTYPRIDKIESMAKYFHVDKASLVEDQSNKSKKDNNAELLAAHIDDNVSDDDMKDILNYIDLVKQAHKNKDKE